MRPDGSVARPPPDVVVMGAGAAGLAAARAIVDAGRSVVVLEARDRIGGRIHTLREPGLAAPIELGAEFVHGTSHAMWDVVDAAGLSAVDAIEEHIALRDGTLGGRDTFSGDVHEVLAALDDWRDDPARSDMSFEALLRGRFADDRHAEAREQARGYVEGFHAAVSARVSVRALGRAEADSSGDAQAFRIVDGYSRVLDWLAVGAGRPLDVRLSSPVRRVAWSDGGVRVAADRVGEISARACVVTLPLAVLAASVAGDRGEGAVAFDPPLDAKRDALDLLEMGQVARFVLRFRRRFWEDGVPSLDAACDPTMLSFMHAPGEPVPVWWTQRAIRAPLLVGWAGGAAAHAVLAHPEAERGDVAIGALARTFGMSERALRDELVSVHHHDWSRDRYARGAYAFVRVGGIDAPARVAAPLGRSLFFAGEHTAAGGGWASVHGALASGRRAADEALAALAALG